MAVDLAEYNFENAKMLESIHFYQSSITEGDMFAFRGLNANDLIFDCCTLPGKQDSKWRFGFAGRLTNLEFKYDPTCPIKGEAYLDFATISDSKNITNIRYK